MTEEGMLWEEAIFTSVSLLCQDWNVWILFDCVIFDLAQSELARELFQSLEYLPCYELVLKSLFDFPKDSFPVIFDRMLESGLYLG